MYQLRTASAGVFALALTACSAFAADMPVKTPSSRVLPVWTWDGFYIGVNGGFSWGRFDTTANAPIFPSTTSVADPKVNIWLGGVQTGVNWQINRLAVFGLEGDFQGTVERDSVIAGSPTVTTIAAGTTTVTLTNTETRWRLPWFGTARARLGLLINPVLLLYGTGGLAGGRVFFSNALTTTVTTTGVGGTTLATTSATLEGNSNRLGWTAGGGIEDHLGPHLSAKVEYLYVDLGTSTFTSGGTTATVRNRDHILRAGFNYTFDASPVVARY